MARSCPQTAFSSCSLLKTTPGRFIKNSSSRNSVAVSESAAPLSRTWQLVRSSSTPPLLDTIAEHAALAKYIDMPLQHASAAVLKRMKRGGSGDVFLKLIERIRRTIPGVAIRTSFIVGFPGETAEDFEELCQFVAAARFDNLGVFAYSDEDTSASYAL